MIQKSLKLMQGNIETCELSNGFRLLQSNYAKYINKQRNRTDLYSGKRHRQNQCTMVISIMSLQHFNIFIKIP